MGKQGVDGVYNADPHKDPDAMKFDDLTYDEASHADLQVADADRRSRCAWRTRCRWSSSACRARGHHPARRAR